MPLIPEIDGTILTIRSVGDHTIEAGVRDLLGAMKLAQEHFETYPVKLHLLFDMLDSEESKSPMELRGVADFFKPYLSFLSGRMAVFVTKTVHYGLSRLYSVHAESGGMDVVPFYDRDEAVKWLTR